MTNVSIERVAVGEFFRRDTFLVAILSAAAGVIFTVFILWYAGVHVFVTMLLLLAGMVGLVPFGVYIYKRFSVRVEVSKQENGTYEVEVTAFGKVITNPPSVSFGFDRGASGQYIMKMGIPDGRGLIVLAETLPRHLSMENIERFYVPPSQDNYLEFTSVRSYPGDLTEVVSLLGFIEV